jgi:hypothetical protein
MLKLCSAIIPHAEALGVPRFTFLSFLMLIGPAKSVHRVLCRDGSWRHLEELVA